jgi:hypothetical protein
VAGCSEVKHARVWAELPGSSSPHQLLRAVCVHHDLAIPPIHQLRRDATRGGGGERVRLCWWGGGHKGGANDGAVAVPKSLVKKRARVAELLM